ncbi:hypothetical protein D3C85_1826840 [compost metagenome]
MYALTHLFPAVKKRYWLILVGLLIFITSFLEPNYTIHVWLGLTFSVKIYPLFQVIIPIVMFIAMQVRKLPAQQPPSSDV